VRIKDQLFDFSLHEMINCQKKPLNCQKDLIQLPKKPFLYLYIYIILPGNIIVVYDDVH
jgi:hypothetical protein